MTPAPIILWLRHDLRLDDHPALTAAVASGHPVLPLYVWAPESEGGWPPGAAARWWLHHALTDLAQPLARRGSRLLVAQGDPLAVLEGLIVQTGARGVYWTRRYDGVAVTRDARIESQLTALGREARSFPGSTLHEPFEVRNRAGAPFQVFTPFFRHLLSLGDPPRPLPAPERIPAPEAWPESLPIEALGLLPRLPWAAGFSRHWRPGPGGAEAALQRWLDGGGWREYAARRNEPGLEDGVSHLSPHLHLGEISPRRIWWALRDLVPEAFVAEHPGLPWLRQLVWREFAQHLLYHFPHTDREPLEAAFAHFPWQAPAAGVLAAWQQGQTGYPLVDAGMRELWQTGWMHNRVRMVVASFLVKHLLIDWRQGAAWFWDTLVDADLANNTLGWQWTAGCGADAAPYFRIFNPVTQGEKFDPEGRYLRRWVPELAALDSACIHAPWQAPAAALAKAGVRLGVDYPRPLVDHQAARARALAALASLRGTGRTQASEA
jgi:deoxyribodipyrimidine photo-lyase